jgi:hypothetical protein
MPGSHERAVVVRVPDPWQPEAPRQVVEREQVEERDVAQDVDDRPALGGGANRVLPGLVDPDVPEEPLGERIGAAEDELHSPLSSPARPGVPAGRQKHSVAHWLATQVVHCVHELEVQHIAWHWAGGVPSIAQRWKQLMLIAHSVEPRHCSVSSQQFPMMH